MLCNDFRLSLRYAKRYPGGTFLRLLLMLLCCLEYSFAYEPTIQFHRMFCVCDRVRECEVRFVTSCISLPPFDYDQAMIPGLLVLILTATRRVLSVLSYKFSW
jgi:hypothetical protein